MTKIAIISDNFPPHPCGGIATSQYNLYLCLIRKGFEVKIFTYLDNDTNEKKKDIIRRGINKYNRILLNLRNKIVKRTLNLINSSLKDEGISYQKYLVQVSSIGIKKINKPLKKFKPDIIIIPDFGAPLYALKKIHNSKIIYVSHHNPIRFINNPLLPLHSQNDAREAIRYEQKSLWKADKIVCPSIYMKNIFINTFQTSQEICVIPNIISEEFIKSVKKDNLHHLLAIDEEIPIIYLPSAGSKIKGENFICEIIRRLHMMLNGKIAFYLSGELSDSQKYELSFFEKYKIKIFSPGKIDYITNISYIKDCYLTISPTLLESFGMAVLESFFCDIPCICFDAGGNAEIFDLSKESCLVSYLDVEELITKSVSLLYNKEKYNETLEFIKIDRRKFSDAYILPLYIDLINCML
ncbi:MAG TPA: glycosyltransferase family 4 protein [Paludibacteraceae bacterium]|nr:glycosyltransferase family 4 protein [Paludibacteraceae bacterium]